MTTDRNYNRVVSFLTKEFKQGVGKLSIIKNDDGSYEFFDRYIIQEVQGRYRAAMKNEDTGTIFSSLKNAVTWCVHDNENRFSRANRIKHLDTLIAGTEVAIEMHKKMLRNSKDVEKTLIHLAKLNEEKSKRTIMIQEMDGYVTDSKHIQTKKFK